MGSGSSRLGSSHRSLILHEHEGLAVSEQRPGPLTACSRAPGGPASRAATSSSSRTSPGRAAGLRFGFLCPPQTEPRERQSCKACGWHDLSPAPSTHPKKAKVKARLSGFAGFCGAAASATALNWCSGASRAGEGRVRTSLLAKQYSTATRKPCGENTDPNPTSARGIRSVSPLGAFGATPEHPQHTWASTQSPSHDQQGLGRRLASPSPSSCRGWGSQLEEGGPNSYPVGRGPPSALASPGRS